MEGVDRPPEGRWRRSEGDGEEREKPTAFKCVEAAKQRGRWEREEQRRRKKRWGSGGRRGGRGQGAKGHGG